MSGRSSAYGDTGQEPGAATLRDGVSALPTTLQVSFDEDLSYVCVSIFKVCIKVTVRCRFIRQLKIM